MTVIPGRAESFNRNIVRQACLGKMQDLNSKITRAKRAEDVDNAVEYMP
jgi:hypothetical protein